MLLMLLGSLNLFFVGVKLWTILGPQPRKKGIWVLCTAAVHMCWISACFAGRQKRHDWCTK